MNVANNKNYPHFNLNDTFIFSKDYNLPFLSPHTPTLLKKPNDSLVKSMKHKKNISENINFSSNKPTNFSKKTNKISHSININTMTPVHNPNGILDHLENLQKSSPAKIQFLSKIRQRKKKALFKSIDLNKNSIDLNKDLKSIVLNKEQTTDLYENKDFSDKKSYLASGKSKKILRFISKNISTDNENLTFKENSHQKFVNFEEKDGLSNKISSNSSLKNVQIKHYKKFVILPPNRMTMIPEYLNLLKILRKICTNFRTINDKNQNKQIIQILNSFIPPKKKYLERFFFLGDRLNPLINEKIMENVCIVQEKQWGTGYKEKLLKPGLLNDLQELNEKMDEYLLKKAMREIKFLEENIKETFNQASKLKRKELWLLDIETLNYEKLKPHSIFDDINEAEKNCGTFELIALKEKKVGRLIDETIKNINFTNKRDKLQMKFLIESYKLN